MKGSSITLDDMRISNEHLVELLEGENREEGLGFKC